MKKRITKNLYQVMPALVALLFIINFSACTPKASDEAAEGDAEEIVVVEEVDVWVIDEHQINDIPVTTKPPKPVLAANTEADDAAEISEEANEAANAMAAQMDAEYDAESAAYDVLTLEAVHADLVAQDYEANEIVEVHQAIIPISETETIVAYNKKGEANAAMQVISSGPDNEIQQIIFTDKKHTDVYDVSAGMTGKEVKQLRKEMKHMVKNGQVFLYDDQSNIMYLMDTVDSEGDEVLTADVETMEVQAVVWKDKKHHQKEE